MPATVEIKTLTPEDAVELTGFETDPEGEYRFPDGTRFNLSRNKTNRPLKEKRYLRYATAILSGNWWPTLESITFDSKKQIVSGVHRLLALIYADHLTKSEPDYATSIGWDGNSPVMRDAVLAYGVRGRATDCTDTGDGRSLGDVFYRAAPLFKDESQSNRVRLSRELGVAVRLVYLRMEGQTISGGEKLEHWKSTAVLESNPGILSCLEMLNKLDSTKDEKRRITGRISLGYAAAITYLGACSSGKFLKKDMEELGKFWKSFAENLHAKNNTIKSLWMVLNDSKTRTGTILTRDELVGVVVRAIKHWAEYEESSLTAKQLLKNPGSIEDRFTGLDELDFTRVDIKIPASVGTSSLSLDLD